LLSAQRDIDMLSVSDYSSALSSGYIDACLVNTNVIAANSLQQSYHNYINLYANSEDCSGGLNLLSGFASLDNYLDPTNNSIDNSCFYDPNASVSTQDKNRWLLFQGMYRYMKTDILYQSKLSHGCLFYDDGNEIAFEPLPLQSTQSLTTNIITAHQVNSPDFHEVCTNNVSVWLADLLHSDCASDLVDISGNDLPEKQALESALLDYCLVSTDYSNPDGYITVSAANNITPEMLAIHSAINAIKNNLSGNVPGCVSAQISGETVDFIDLSNITVDSPYLDCDPLDLPEPINHCFNLLVSKVNTHLSSVYANSPTFYGLFNQGTDTSLEDCVSQEFTQSNNYLGLTDYEVRLYDHAQSSGNYKVALRLYDDSNQGISLNSITTIKSLHKISSSPVSGSGVFSFIKCEVVLNDGHSKSAYIFHDGSLSHVLTGGYYPLITYCIPNDYDTTLYDVPVDFLQESEDNCISFLLNESQYNAQSDYSNLLLESSSQLSLNYSSRCISEIPQEDFTVSYQLKEYQYTLYYYDQAGNLVQTVPPEGVDIIVPQFDANTGDFIGSNPNHTLNTTYAYNSAEQPISRIIEVGESSLPLNATLFQIDAQDNSYPTTGWNITRTYYDNDIDNSVLIQSQFTGGQQHLRSRINRVEYLSGTRGINITSITPKQVQYYSYDVHGNVKELVNYNSLLSDLAQGYKKTVYSYDLISGNVNEVGYQPGSLDAYYHRYCYDAENRLTLAESSSDHYLWDKEAKYFYYLHGPMSRVEIGTDKVQATDYAYTIHGWLKGVNSSTAQSDRDLGSDGHLGQNKWVSEDAFGFSLGYFQGDYQSIGSSNFLADISTSVLGNSSSNVHASLYNGNISSMITALKKPDESSMTIQILIPQAQI